MPTPTESSLSAFIFNVVDVVVVVVVVVLVLLVLVVVTRMWGFPTIQALSLVAIMGTVRNDGSNNC